ncbi:MAG: hypothetical protein ACM65L_15755 [Microcoleus sp.]
MKDLSNFSAAERVESLKAGAVAAFGVFWGFGAIALANTFILVPRFDFLAGLQVSAIDLNFAFKGSIALLSGFLFGVTYRYALRTDTNPQLKSGVVLAFGLVRAFGQLDAGWFFEAGKLPVVQELLPFVVGSVESVVLFAIAGFVLDWAMGRSYIKPFNS